MMMGNFAIRLPAETKERLSKLADREQRTIGQVVRMAVDAYLAQHE
jgi:predicted DNA-binding protein